MIYKLIPDITSATIVPDEFYHYIQRPNSITHTYTCKLYDILINLENIIEYYKAEEIYNDYKKVCFLRIYLKYFNRFFANLVFLKEKNSMN